MKNLKKLFSLAMAMVMALSLMTAAASAVVVEGDSSTTTCLTISGAVEGETYDLYRMLELSYQASTEDDVTTITAISYSIDETWLPFFTGVGAEYLIAENTGGLNTVIVGDANMYLNITEANIVDFTNDAMTFAISLGENGMDRSAPNAELGEAVVGGKLNVDNLNLGYYLLMPRGASEIKENKETLASVVNVVNCARGVEVKAEYPDLVKEIDRRYVEIGETVNYTLVGEVPNTAAYETRYIYRVLDTMSDGLTFQADKLVAYFWNDTNKDGVVDSNEKTFVDLESDNIIYTYGDHNFVLEFNMVAYQEHVGQAVMLEYSAVVNEDAVFGSEGMPNYAYLEYSNNPHDYTDVFPTPPTELYVYTAKIDVVKVDGDDTEKKLSGAKFALKNAEGEYYNYTASVSETDNAADVSWVKDVAEATTMVTGENGTIVFQGLKAGTYFLEELESPKGYNLLTEDVKVVIEEELLDVDESGEKEILIHSPNKTVEVANQAGTLLPETGGMGTTIFYVLGGLLAVGAAVLLITKKRMGDEV